MRVRKGVWRVGVTERMVNVWELGRGDNCMRSIGHFITWARKVGIYISCLEMKYKR